MVLDVRRLCPSHDSITKFFGVFSIATGVPRADQDMTSFARELCTENQTQSRDGNVKNKKKLQPRRRFWFTETRT